MKKTIAAALALLTLFCTGCRQLYGDRVLSVPVETDAYTLVGDTGMTVGGKWHTYFGGAYRLETLVKQPASRQEFTCYFGEREVYFEYRYGGPSAEENRGCNKALTKFRYGTALFAMRYADGECRIIRRFEKKLSPEAAETYRRALLYLPGDVCVYYYEDKLCVMDLDGITRYEKQLFGEGGEFDDDSSFKIAHDGRIAAICGKTTRLFALSGIGYEEHDLDFDTTGCTLYADEKYITFWWLHKKILLDANTLERLDPESAVYPDNEPESKQEKYDAERIVDGYRFSDRETGVSRDVTYAYLTENSSVFGELCRVFDPEEPLKPKPQSYLYCEDALLIVCVEKDMEGLFLFDSPSLLFELDVSSGQLTYVGSYTGEELLFVVRR